MTFWQAWCERGIVLRGLKVALIVGTALIAINQGMSS